MEPLLFADENAPEWAFSKRKGVKKAGKVLFSAGLKNPHICFAPLSITS